MKSLEARKRQRAYLAGVNAGEIKDEVATDGTEGGTPVTGAVDFSKRTGEVVNDGNAETDSQIDGGVNGGQSQTQTAKPLNNRMNKTELLDYIAARNGDTSDASNSDLYERAKALPADIPAPASDNGGNGAGAGGPGWGQPV